MKKAREHVRHVLAQVKQARTLIEERGADDAAEVIEKRFPELGKVAKRAQHVDDDNIINFVKTTEVTGGYEADEFVTEFLNMWEGREPYRDTMSRIFIDPQNGATDQDFQIFVAGDKSWGDGPYDNTGWWFCERASWLGIIEILGIY